MKILFMVDKFVVEPLGVAYLASAVKKAGHDALLSKMDDKMFEDLDKFKPDIVAYSMMTGKHRRILETNLAVKEYRPSVISIFGGSHPTYFPEMIRNRGVDAIIRGEADRSFVEWLSDIQMKRVLHRVIEFRSLVQTLDKLPFPDREFLYRYDENRNNMIKNVMTSRGCRYACPYCFNSLYRSFYKNETWTRYRSPENVIRECVELKKYPLGMIYFQDDEFLSNPNLLPLLDLYKKDVKVPFHCQLRIELLTEDTAKKLKDSGCTGVTFAIESGNEKLRKEVLRRHMSDAMIINGAEILHKVGLKFRTENMCGAPTETVDDMMKTLDLNIKVKPTIGWCSIFQPYPRIPLGELAQKMGLWDGSFDLIKETFFEDSVLNIPNKHKIANFQRLFGFIVSFPVLRGLVRFLISLPRNKLYDWIHLKWKDVLYNKRLYKV